MGALERAARLVRGGGVLLVPTETVYGLSGDARRPDVAARIHQLKGGRPGKPFLALTDAWDRVEGWVEADAAVRRLWAADLGPLTLVLPATAEAPPPLVGPGGSVGLRRTSSPFLRALVARAGCPVFSTSANPSGAPPPARFADVDPGLRRGVDLAVEGDRDLGGAPSTVARYDGGAFRLVREGPVGAAAIAAASGVAAHGPAGPDG